MMAVRQREPMSYAEYLVFEERALEKHEWLDGFVRELPTSGPGHAGLSAAALAEIANALEGKRCRAYASTVRIRVEATGLATYSDGTVVCEGLAIHAEDANAVTNPRLLLEVVSESTEAYDRGEKFSHYRRIASLRELVFVAESERWIEVWRRDGNRWQVLEARTGESVELETTGARLEVDRVYHDPTS